MKSKTDVTLKSHIPLNEDLFIKLKGDDDLSL